MSSSNNSPYRSRLFNFVNRQSRRLIEKSERAIRNLKVAATWGAQILLYPAYLLVQATISAGRQLRGEAKSGASKLNSSSQSTSSQPQTIIPAADTPIQEILKEVTILPLPEPQIGGDFNIEPSLSTTDKTRPWLKPRTNSLNPLKWIEIIISQSSFRGLKLLDSGFNHWRSAPLTQKININNLSANQKKFWSPGFLSFVQADASITQTEADGKLIPDSQKITNNTIPELAHQSWLIQGVATLLETRSLVLVTVENEILDILTSQQQQKLSARISWELANLFRQWRIARKSHHSKQPRLLSTMARPNLFPPVRMFWQVMGWVQTSQIAIAVNLFDESTLVTSTNSPNIIEPLAPVTEPLVNSTSLIQPLEPAPAPLVKNILTKILPEKALSFLESKVRGLDSHALAAESQSLVQELKNAIVLRQETQNAIEKGEERASLLGLLVNTKDSGNDSPLQPLQSLKTHPFWLQDLIYRAIEYFFGRYSNLLETDSEQAGEVNQISGINYTSKSQSKLPPSEIENDPWLTWNDLFGNSDTAATNTTPSQANPAILKGDSPKSPPQLPEGLNSKIATTAKKSPWGLFHRYLKPKGNITIIDNDTKEENPETQKGLVEESSKNLQNMLGKLTVSVKEQFTVEASGTIALNSNPLASLSLGVSTEIHDSFPRQKYRRETPKQVKRRKNKQKSKNKELAPTQNPIQLSEPVSNLDIPIIPQTVPKTQNQQLTTENTKITEAPDWIETKAIRTGYVKHPLELILEWLDRAIVWLEELLIKVLEWVRKLWSRR